MSKPKLVKSRLKVRTFLQDTWFDYLDDSILPTTWVDHLADVIDWFYGKMAQAACKLLGHDPIMDQCMMPKHDYCALCFKLTPGEAHE